jgi:hypothetical protein
MSGTEALGEISRDDLAKRAVYPERCRGLESAESRKRESGRLGSVVLGRTAAAVRDVWLLDSIVQEITRSLGRISPSRERFLPPRLPKFAGGGRLGPSGSSDGASSPLWVEMLAGAERDDNN